MKSNIVFSKKESPKPYRVLGWESTYLKDPFRDLKRGNRNHAERIHRCPCIETNTNFKLKYGAMFFVC